MMLLPVQTARAQLMLQGAVEAQPPAAAKSAPGAKSQNPNPAALKPPSEEAISGRELSLYGAGGSIAFQAGPGHQLEITKLSLAGESISHPAEECRVDVVGDGPIKTRFVGRPGGAFRYEADVAACPFSLDLLEGAVLVTRSSGSCDFAAAGCRVDPAGLWGPAGDSITPSQTAQLERERSRAESVMRTNFRALLASAGNDQEAVTKIASEQAGFSSEREMTCRNYLHEDVHGFCALRMTQARALALWAAFEQLAKTQAHLGSKPAQATPHSARAKRQPAANLGVDTKAASGREPGQ